MKMRLEKEKASAVISASTSTESDKPPQQKVLKIDTSENILEKFQRSSLFMKSKIG
jgi:hypothetical protein